MPMVVPIEGRRCPCGRGGCTAKDPHPPFPLWVANYTTDQLAIHRLWNRWPEAIVGLHTALRGSECLWVSGSQVERQMG